MCLERVCFPSEIANNALVDVINVLSKLGGFYVQPANFATCKTASYDARNGLYSSFLAKLEV